MPELSIVLPCYNEIGNIPQILSRYYDIAKKINLELVLVNNGSTDNSNEIFKRELENPKFGFVRLIQIEKNIGYGHGIKTGLSQCKSKLVGFSHADLQCPPEDIERVYHAFREFFLSQPLLIKGCRLGRCKQDTFVSEVYRRLAEILLGISLGDINGQPKIFPRSFVPIILKGPNDFSFDLYVLYQAAINNVIIKEIDVFFEPRQYGFSKWSHNRVTKFVTILKAVFRIIQMRCGKAW